MTENAFQELTDIPPEVLADAAALVGESLDRVVEQAAPKRPNLAELTEAQLLDLISCKVCGQPGKISRRTGRCDKCKHKKIVTPETKQSAQPAAINIVAGDVAELEALRAEVVQLRHLLAARQPMPLADFRERVEMCQRALVETYEDGGVKIVFDVAARRAMVKPIPDTPPERW